MICHLLYSIAGKKRWHIIEEDQPLVGIKGRHTKGGPPGVIPLSKIELQFVRWTGEEYEADITCDSGFMVKHMDEIGKQIRKAYHWVPRSQEIILIMDNAGGHGTKDCIDKYVQMLWDKHRIRVRHQVPRSPDCNLLDLGVWMSIQAYVEKVH